MVKYITMEDIEGQSIANAITTCLKSFGWSWRTAELKRTMEPVI